MDTDHVIDGLMWALRFTIDGVRIATSGFNNGLIFKAERHDVGRAGKIAFFVYT